MAQKNNASLEYLRSAILTATQEQLQLMLFDGAIRFVNTGIDALRAGRFEEMFNAFERAQRIVLELGYGLRREVNPALVDQMAALYNFCYGRLVDATMQRDEKAAAETLRILTHQRETWVMLMEKIAADQGPPSRFQPDPPTQAPPSPDPARRTPAPAYGSNPADTSGESNSLSIEA